ncbi:MAG: hypothetical protein JNK57_02545 [Planctomycetaceae bacterium]|nr:hypothetical protein [Planctomycetaceae bacterium]
MQRNGRLLFDIIREAVTTKSGTLVHTPTSQEWKQVIAELRGATELLEELRAAGTKPVSGFLFSVDTSSHSETERQALNIKPDPLRDKIKQAWPIYAADLDGKAIHSMELPHVMRFFESFCVLMADARLAIHEQDWDRALRDIDSLRGIAHHVVELKVTTNAYLHFGMHSYLLDLIEELLNSGESVLTDTQLEKLQRTVEPKTMAWDDYFGHERLVFKDLIQRVYSWDSQGNGRLTVRGVRLLHELDETLKWEGAIGSMFEHEPESSWNLIDSGRSVLVALNNKSRRQVEAAADKIFDSWSLHAGRPYNSNPFEEGVFEIYRMRQTRADIFNHLTPLDSQHEAYLKLRDCRQAVAAAIAVMRFRKAEQRLPASFDELVGKYLEQVPKDHINDLPLVLVSSEGKFRIYSLGWDGVDQDGRYRKAETYLESKMLEKDRSVLRDSEHPHPSKYNNSGTHDFDDWNLWPRHRP